MRATRQTRLWQSRRRFKIRNPDTNPSGTRIFKKLARSARCWGSFHPSNSLLRENTSNILPNRKKFRKMMHRFDEQMYHSDTLYRREYQAEQKAKKLAQENE